MGELACLYWVMVLRHYDISNIALLAARIRPAPWYLAPHASYQGEEIRAEAPSLRAIFTKKERIASQKLISLPLSRDSPYANSEPASNRSSVTSEPLQVVSAILPRTVRLCVGNEHRQPHASPTESPTRCIEPASS